MLRFFQIVSADNATRYYNGALSRGDYHSEEGRSIGTWHGKAAERLGLSGEVTGEAFAALANNRHPVTGKSITPRNVDNRTVGNDITMDAPKSISLLWALTGDRRIRRAFEESVQETMLEIERDTATRVQIDGKHEERNTANAVWSTFIHETTRPGDDGLPDPQLHAHNVMFNLTFDNEERRFKAVQFRELRRDAPYYQAAMEARLAARLRDQLGYAVVRRGKSWEIEGIDRRLIEKFARRTQEIEKLAGEHNITDPTIKDQLGAKTRRKKSHDLGTKELRNYWASRLTATEQKAMVEVFDRAQARGRGGVPPAITAKEAIDYASRHLFERQSVVPERKLLGEALRYGVGSVTVDQVKDALKDSKLLFAERDGKRLYTTAEIRAEEQRIIAYARDGRGTRKPLGKARRESTRAWLNRGQKAAVRHILDSCDAVTVLIGGAGSGKTTLFKEVKDGIEENGRQLFAFAPSADASRGTLRSEGFDADTVARLLVDEKLQEQIRGQVALIDEVGMLSTKTMAKLFDLAKRLDIRLILAGDDRQHGAVERSGAGALRLLEHQAGLKFAVVTQIERQQGKYKDVVEQLRKGNTDAALDQLEAMGWLREITGEERERHLAADYLQAVGERKKNGDYKTALVISPTRKEGERITLAIRDALKERGLEKTKSKGPMITGPEREFLRLERVDWTEAQRGDAVRYAEEGLVVQFAQNCCGFTRGERAAVVAADAKGVQVQMADGKKKLLPLDQAEHFQLFRNQSLLLAVGDRVRISNNGKTKDGGHKLDNGALYTVKGFTRGGDIQLSNGWVVDKGFGHVASGYVMTSFSSQSKTVDQVFIGQSEQSSPAASQEQLYVSVSRGREKAILYHDSLPGLREAVRKSDERLTATELVGEKARRRALLLEHLDHMRRWVSITREKAGQVATAARTRAQVRGMEHGR